MISTKLTEKVFWVGIIDWNLRDFHGYETRRGTTYNAYLINDEKKVLIDTVKYPFKTILAKKIEEHMNLQDLDYIIVNHVEMDHSSSLEYIMRYAKNATIISSKRGKDSLIKYYGSNGWTFQTVKTGDELNVGNRTLKFVEAPMLHWPDSMFTYLKQDQILMPNDAFGQHLATSKRFDDEINQSILYEEAAKYYANILMPFASIIIRKIEEITKMGVKPRIIAPSHGIIWRSNPNGIVNSYLKWSKGDMKKKAVIVYDTMWGSTRKMAYSISEGLMKEKVEVHLHELRKSDIANILHEILEAKAVIVGSPTINGSLFPSVSSFLSYVGGLRPIGKIWASFGSYGWGGGAARDINERFTKFRFEIAGDSLQIQFTPNQDELGKCRDFGVKIARKITHSLDYS